MSLRFGSSSHENDLKTTNLSHGCLEPSGSKVSRYNHRWFPLDFSHQREEVSTDGFRFLCLDGLRNDFFFVAVLDAPIPQIDKKQLIVKQEIFLGGGNSNFMFTPKIGEDAPILTSIFFKGVETSN